jgi:hypothetical protein
LSPQPVRSNLAIAAAIVIAGALISASLFFAVGQGVRTVTVTGNAATNSAGPANTFTSTGTITTTKTVTMTCSPAATQEDSLYTFRADVIYSGQWNATATGYTNTAADQVFTKCYTGSDPGWILIAGWNSQGGNILNITVQKLDSGNGNLTAVLFGQVRSTTAAYGSVKIGATAVP